MEEDKEFLEYIVKGIVTHPDSVEVARKVDEMGVLLTLKVHPEDMGQIIGKSGATARAVRTLLRIIGMKNNARVNLKIEEPEGSTHVRREAMTPQESEQSSEAAEQEMASESVAEEQQPPTQEPSDVNVDEALGNLD